MSAREPEPGWVAHTAPPRRIGGARAIGGLAILLAAASDKAVGQELRWEWVPGQAYDIAVAAQGVAWVIGVDSQPGGFGVHRWATVNWQNAKGGAVRIAVDETGTPWIVNDAGDIYVRQGTNWRQLSGKARDIGAGGGAVWIIGTDRQSGGYGVWRWTRYGWEPAQGAGVRIAVDGRGTPWVVNERNDIWVRRDSTWTKLPGRARDIGAGGNGQAWVIGNDRTEGGYRVWRWTGSTWERSNAGGVAITVSPEGIPWVVNDQRNIYRALP